MWFALKEEVSSDEDEDIVIDDAALDRDLEMMDADSSEVCAFLQ